MPSGEEALAVVMLAESDGQVWVIEGDEHLGALLVNELPDGVTVEIMACVTRAAVFALWRERSAEATDGAQPWLINPIIADRIRRSLGVLARAVIFTPWSAMLDAAATAELMDAASWLAANPAGRLVLRQFASMEPMPGLADLQRLRCQLALGALGRAGADLARMGEDMAVAAANADADRLVIMTELPATPASA